MQTCMPHRRSRIGLTATLAVMTTVAFLFACTSGIPSDIPSALASEEPADTEANVQTEYPTGMDSSTYAPLSHPETDTQSDARTADEILWDTLSGKRALRARGRVVSRLTKPADCPTAQGGWFDGLYWYQLMIRKDTASNEADNTVRLCKVDTATGETIAISDPLPLNHANDLTYNSRRNLFIAVNNNPNRRMISLIDPVTLHVTGTVTLSNKIFSLAYCPERDQYVAGLSGGQRFCLLDADFQQVAGPFTPTQDTAGYITQGCACDAQFIYFVLYKQNVITVYDWSGRHIRTLPISVSGEPENITQVGGRLYVVTGGAQVTLYWIDLQEKT